MTQDLDRDPKRSETEWQTLAEFTLPSVEGNERQAMEQVAEAVRHLGLPADRLARLKTAVAEATMNATEHGNRFQADLPVSICVMTSEQDLSVEITDYGSQGTMGEHSTPDIEAKLEGAQSTRGWGFFLIEKMVDEIQIQEDQAHHTIQLFLYLEGDGSPGSGC